MTLEEKISKIKSLKKKQAALEKEIDQLTNEVEDAVEDVIPDKVIERIIIREPYFHVPYVVRPEPIWIGTTPGFMQTTPSITCTSGTGIMEYKTLNTFNN